MKRLHNTNNRTPRRHTTLGPTSRFSSVHPTCTPLRDPRRLNGTSRRLKRGRNGSPSSWSIRLQDRSRLSRDERPSRWGAHDRIAAPSSSFEDRFRATRAYRKGARKIRGAGARAIFLCVVHTEKMKKRKPCIYDMYVHIVLLRRRPKPLGRRHLTAGP